MSEFRVVPTMFGEPPDWWDEHKDRSVRNARFHCGTCGRFVKSESIVVTPHWEYGYGSEQDEEGECSVHGKVTVFWRE